ncbi:MAG: diguanylate cyclase [Hoeflea sp.]|uniref:diguanylate cyclase domain-containing protein n=2 Tax=Alphaproteobacteria TaxID=28211 RepID=UPI00329A3061
MKNRSGTGPASNIALGVYALCAAVIMVFAAANLKLLSFAGGVADDVRLEVEHHLMQAEIDRQIEILVRDQEQISHWDKTVISLGGTVDEDFVNDEIADWMWEDFAIESSVVVRPDNTPLLTVFKDEVMTPANGAVYVARSSDLIEATRTAYFARRKPDGDGFRLAGKPAYPAMPLYAADVRLVDGSFGVVVAQAIIPDDVAVLADGVPLVLLTFKPLTAQYLGEIGRNLGLEDLRIGPVVAAEKGRGSMLVNQVSGQQPLAASWRVEQPSAIIWTRAIGPLAASLVLVALALFLVSMRYGRVLRALQHSEARNHHRAMHDALTGLPNRLQFDEALDGIIAKRQQGRCAILCLDLDKFKAVNDTYGHQVGDLVIKTAARRIADAVGDDGMAARVGGDEFIILLWDKLDHANVLARCDRMIASICEDIDFEGGVARIGASIGVAWWPDDALTSKDIIRSADEALYRAKDNGRSQAWLACDSGEAGCEAVERRKPAAGAGVNGAVAA